MSPLHALVKDLGGELSGHSRAHIPAPGHSKDDRSISLLLTEDRRLVIHTFGNGSDWREVRDALRERGYINAQGQLIGDGVSDDYHAPDRSKIEKQATAQRIWDLGRPVAGTLSERHARLRAITRPLSGGEVFRHVQDCPLAIYDNGTRTKPALVAAIRTPEGELTAVEITYLAPNGRRADQLRIPRKMVGPVPRGSAVRIDTVSDEMLVAEGIFTTLSASERFQLPAWALLSTSIMKNFTPPASVRSLLIAGDNGKDGRRTANLLAERLRSPQLHVRIEFPPDNCDDFNRLAQNQTK